MQDKLISLLDIYIEKNKDLEWFKRHFSLSVGASGNMFEFIGTNSRNLFSFEHQFSEFLEIENKPRTQWPKQENHGQEIHKQYVVNMLQSKLFKKDPDGLFNRTQKGILYGNFINIKIPKEEAWLINYVFLLNGYYSNRKNYIIDRVKNDLLTSLLSVGALNVDFLIQNANNLLRLENNNFSSVLENDFFYIHSFYDDQDFLERYLRSSDLEKKELASYIKRNIEDKNFVCCLSKKYQPGGNFNQSMLMEEVKIFLLTTLFIQSHTKEPKLAHAVLLDYFDSQIKNINKNRVTKYFIDNSNIFYPIFEDVLEIEDLKEEVIEDVVTGEPDLLQIDVPEDYIDETENVGRQKIKTIYSIRKRQAKIQNNYNCSLEKINNCRYFTAKINNKNYVELHHLIPREFRNDFPYSIEVLANYITLCPHCHRQIHFATDRERKHLVNTLYNERKNRLDTVGLKIELDDIYKYYNINP